MSESVLRYESGRWSHWSRPVEFTAPSPAAAVEVYRYALALSEIMFHPAGASNDDERATACESADFEFI